MIVIGENLNATRKLRVGGARVEGLDDGRFVIRYKTIDGEDRVLDVSDSARDADGNTVRFVPHIAVGIFQRDEEYIRTAALLQERAGADYIDVCVDEISPNPEDRYEHIQWAVRTVQDAVSVPVSIDSSDTGCIHAALEVYDFDQSGPPIINSVNLEEARLPLVEIAKSSHSSLIANASGEVQIPADVEGRLENLGLVMDRMDAAGIPMERRFLDPLVLPIATDNSNGKVFFEAVRRLRERYPDVHITGGFSNVSFGLPKRRVLNDAMTYLAREAGADTAFIDPTASKEFDLEDEGFRKAIAALRGEDEYCADYMMWAQG
jgi:5-methyltetrahydrofolate--homocysteine methyltransferase